MLPSVHEIYYAIKNSHFGLNGICNLEVKTLREIILFKQIYLFQKDPTKSLEI